MPPDKLTERSPELDIKGFLLKPENYTVVDVRNPNETNAGLIFSHSITIPLPELREHISDIPTHKPIVVHCAAGYRSAAGASIIAAKVKNVPVYDLGEAVLEVVAR